MEQRSAQWFQVRWGKVTASRMADILAKTKSGYAATRKNYMAQLLIERLTPPPTEDTSWKNEAMIFGTVNEPVARLEYELETGNEVQEAFFEALDDDIGASPDGYIGEDGLIEIKVPNTDTHLETLRTGKVPTQYFTQMQGQMLCTGREWCDFVSYDPRLPVNAQLFIKRVPRDELFIKGLRKELALFIKELEQQVKFVQNYKGVKDEIR